MKIMSNSELIHSVLKRVSALSGVEGKCYHDNTGYYVVWKGHVFDESARSSGELIAYLHGLEDMIKYKDKF